MAIQLALPNNLNPPEIYQAAYAKIIQQSSDNNGDKTSFSYHVAVWASQASRQARLPIIDDDRYEVMAVDLVSVDMAGLYQHLMQQEKYKLGVEI